MRQSTNLNRQGSRYINRCVVCHKGIQAVQDFLPVNIGATLARMTTTTKTFEQAGGEVPLTRVPMGTSAPEQGRPGALALS